MKRRIKNRFVWLLITSITVSTLLTGCQPMQPYYLDNGDCDLSHYLDTATDIEYTDVCQEPLAEVTQAKSPRTVSNPQLENVEWKDVTLEEAISTALHNSKVIRTFGQVRQFGQVVGSPPERLSAAPDSVGSVYDVAIQETSQNGVEQVLSNFDAIFNSSISWDNTDRPQNFVGGNVNSVDFQQDRVTIDNEISKRSATGTQWFVRNQTIYTGSNNQLTRNTRAVPSDWYTALEFEARQPLLRNRGAMVNRVPVVLARIRTDLSLVDFENSVAELLNGIEFAYWDLHFFYHNLQAAKTGRDSAQAAWQKVSALEKVDGGEAAKEAQAKEQYFFFRGRVEDAQRDLFKAENRLRYLMGLTPTDNRLLRPIDKPTTARVAFEWSDVLHEGLCRSSAIRRQGWRIKSREMELLSARNQLLPRFDTVALGRILGVGDEFNSFDRGGLPDFPGIGSTAVDQLWDGGNSEFRLGAELEIPLGFRRELTQVRNSQLALARERAKLETMELEITHQLTDAIQDVDAGYRSLATNFSRRVASEQQVAATEAQYLAGQTSLDLLLDAQRRQAEASISYYQALVNYNESLITLQMRKGTLLEYNGVQLAEGPWPAKAYFDAANRARRRDASHYLDYGFTRPNVISRGPSKNGCPPAVQPATFTDDPYASIDSGSYDAGSGDNSDLEPTPDGNSGRSKEDALNDAIDNMSGGDSGKKPTKPKKRDSGLKDLKEPPRPSDSKRAGPSKPSQPSTAPSGELPAPSVKPETNPRGGYDDLEAALERRTARTTKPKTRRTTSKAMPPTPGGVQIKWKN